MSDHFSRLGLARGARIDLDVLERNYLSESRKVHPDLNSDRDEAELIAESAALNEAYAVLKSPWRRYRYLLELIAPGALEAAKRLDPAFLAEAMELGESVEQARDDEAQREELEQELYAELDERADRVEALLEAGNTKKAARELHEARYYERALENLQRKDGSLL